MLTMGLSFFFHSGSVRSFCHTWMTGTGSVDKRPGYTKAEKRTMLLSSETLLGLRITGVIH